MNIRKRSCLLLASSLIVLTAGAVYYGALHHNRDALWQIVSQQCVPNQLAQQQPLPCLTVDFEQRSVLFKDRKGPYHDLLMPIDPIAGIESDILVQPQTPNFMAQAWAQRQRLADEANKIIADEWFALAINSRLGRTQNHLHIHIACLQPDIHHTLTEQTQNIGFEWTHLAEPLKGQHYWARRLSYEALAQDNPFELLDQLLKNQDKQPGDYGLAMVKLADGDFLLLATGINLWALDLGSTERIQDFSCTAATRAQSNVHASIAARIGLRLQ